MTRQMKRGFGHSSFEKVKRSDLIEPAEISVMGASPFCIAARGFRDLSKGSASLLPLLGQCE